jgi:hypothetical protein
VKKKRTEVQVVEAELLPAAFDPASAKRTPEQIAEDEKEFQFRLRARKDAIGRMGPDERFDAVSALTDMIQLKLAERILEREAWLDHPDIAVREEAQNFIVAIQDQINQITKTRVALYLALGLGEKRGIVGGKEVPRLLLPSRTAEDFEKQYAETLQQFGAPKGDA